MMYDMGIYSLIGRHILILFIVCGGELMTIEDPLLSAHGYQLLAIATSYLVGNNREIDVLDIFLRCFIHCLWRGAYDH